MNQRISDIVTHKNSHPHDMCRGVFFHCASYENSSILIINMNGTYKVVLRSGCLYCDSSENTGRLQLHTYITTRFVKFNCKNTTK